MLIEFIENDILSHAKNYLRKATFTKFKPEMLALSIIKEIRIKYNLRGWNSHL